MYKCFCLLAILLVAGCKQPDEKIDYNNLPAATEQGINAVIEIPAGTNHKIEFDKQLSSFQNDKRNGKDRIISFLPYPGNYGFIPSTNMPREEGGDGDPLDVMVLCEAQPTGTVMKVLPVAALLLEDEGEADTKIIAVPVDTSLQVIPVQDFRSFSIDYDGAKHIIETWFLYYDGLGTNEFKGWKDETYARELVKKWNK